MTSSMEKCFLFPCLILLATCSIVQSQFNTGATVNECESLEPALFTPLNPDNAPFIVAVTSPSYQPGIPVNVFIASAPPAVNVRGLVIQARRANSLDTRPVGSFSVPDNNLYRSLPCGTSTTGTLTNTDDTTKTLPLSFMWTPTENVGDVQFFVSLAETNGNFWSRITQQTPLPIGLTIDTCPTPTIQGSQASWTSPNCLFDNTVLANSATCTPLSGSTFQTGDTEVTCSCENQGQTASCSFTVTIMTVVSPCDPNPCENGGTCIPVSGIPSGFFCQCPAGLPQPTCTTVLNNPPSAPNCPLSDVVQSAPAGATAVQVNYDTVVCTDVEDGTITASCDSPSMTFFTLGTTTVTCTCADSASQMSSCTFNVVVNQIGGACANNPCLGNECRVSSNSLAGYTCHSVTGTPCTL